MRHSATESGFSTVELLISLFIAAAFIGTGFQLFSVVMKDSNDARLRAQAGTIVNRTLQEAMNSTNSPCNGPLPPSYARGISPDEMQLALASVSYSCPYGNSSKTTRIKVVFVYGLPQKTIEGSLDVAK